MKFKLQKHLLPAFLALILAGMGNTAGAAERVLVDQVGRQVGVPHDPRRVVAMAPSITEIVFALGQQDRLVGVTRFSDFPSEASQLPNVGSYVHLDLEKIVILRPDLCIAIKDGKPVEVANRLNSLDIPVYAVNPNGLDTVMATILEIGQLLNARPEALRLTRKLQARIDRVKSRVAQTEGRPGVFFQIGIAPIVSVGSATFINELIVTAGGRNLTQGVVPYPRYSREQVLALAPDIIIITSMAREAVFDQVRAEWQRWPLLPAVKNDRIYLEDSNLFDRPTPRLVDGLELLMTMIHPELADSEP